MLDEFRSTNITWDKATSRIYSPVTANASDENGRKLVVQVINSGQVEDLTGATLHLYWETRDKAHDGLDVFKAVDLEKGEFELSYTTGMLSNHGVLNANLVLIDTVGRVVSERFKITVTEGIDNDAIQSENSFTALTQALIDVSNLEQNYAPRLNDLTAQLQQTVKKGQVSVNDINKNYGLIDETYLSDSLKAQMAGTTAIGSTPPDKSITPTKAAFFETGKNKVDNTKFTQGYYVNPTNGALVGNASHMVSDYTLLKPGVVHNVNYHGRLAFYADKNIESFVSGLDFASTNPPITFTTPSNAKYARYSINSTTALETFQIEEGEVTTPYEKFYEKIPQELLSLPETTAFAEPYLIKGGTDDIPSAPFVTASENNTRVDTKPIKDDGILKKIAFRASKSGNVKIKFFSLADNLLTLENEVSLIARAGYNTYEADVDFLPFEVAKGWLVGFYSSANDPKLSFIAGSGINSYTIIGVDASGTVSATTTASYNIAISVTVEQTIAQLASKIDKLSIGGTSTLAEPSRLLLSETFEDSSAPPQFTNSGFTLGNGASFSGTGGIANQLVWTKDSTLNTSKTRVWFTPTTTSADLAIVRKHPLNAGLGSIFRLNGAEQKLIIYAPWTQNTTSLPGIAKEATLTVPIVANRQYLLELERQTISKHILRITDTITGESQELVNDYVDTRIFSVGNGYVGVMAFGGSFTINKMQYASNEPIKPRIAFYGDSFVEAATLILDGGVQLRYADLVKAKLDGSAYINGRGGDKSAELVNKITSDFNAEQADYTVLAIGTNDTVFDTWLANITKLIEKVESKGSIPILMTLTKMTSLDRTAFMTAVNDWIINSGYLYVDANLATTLNNDRQTQDTSLFKADGVHPNVAGHEVIYRRFLLDAPEVFDGY